MEVVAGEVPVGKAGESAGPALSGLGGLMVETLVRTATEETARRAVKSS